MPQLTATQSQLLNKLNLSPSDPDLKSKIQNILNKQGQKPHLLPNLEFKFVCANSLVGIKHLDNALGQEKIEEKQNELANFRLQTFQPAQNKAELTQKWQTLTKELLETQINSGFYAKETSTDLTTWNPFQNKPAEFFDPEWMFGESGFDLVIGNPPYVSLSKMSDESKKGFDIYKTYSKSTDLYCLFYERGWQILQPNGILSFITSNSWMRTKYGQSLRSFFANHTNPLSLVDFADVQVFESAVVASNILTFQKSIFNQKMLATNIDNSFVKKDGIADFVSQKGVILTTLDDNGWTIGNRETMELKKKMEENGKFLKDWSIEINYGIKTGFNEAFVIDEEKKNELITNDPKSAEIIKPILRGRDIKRYGYEFANLYVINSHNGVKEKNISPINISNYPAIKEHLDSFEPALSKRSDKGVTPYNLRNCAYLDEFEKEKIAWIELADIGRFTFVPAGVYTLAGTFIMTGKNLKFILACLNSKISSWYFNQISTNTGVGTNMWKKYKIEQLPIPLLNTPEKQQIAGQVELLVEEILEVKEFSSLRSTHEVGEVDIEVVQKSTPSSLRDATPQEGNLENLDTANLEGQIDELVFELYGLDEGEIAVILG
jgi:hypothetical protein